MSHEIDVVAIFVHAEELKVEGFEVEAAGVLAGHKAISVAGEHDPATRQRAWTDIEYSRRSKRGIDNSRVGRVLLVRESHHPSRFHVQFVNIRAFCERLCLSLSGGGGTPFNPIEEGKENPLRIK